MVETLTESFCERCGTRYEFRAPTRLNPLRKTRGLFGGLKNYLTSQDDFGDAMGDAMRGEEDQLASAQLEAFHESFNFCINCRQYTCVNCWNDDSGRCRSCAPIAGTDDLAERIAASVGSSGAIAHAEHEMADATMAETDIQRRLGLEAWPTADAAPDSGMNGHAPSQWPSADELIPAAAADGLVEPEPEPVVAEVEPQPEPVVAEVEPEPEPVVAEVEPEPEPVVAEVEPEPEPVVAEVEVEPEPEPVVAEVEPEPRVLRVVSWDEDSAYEVAPPVRELELEPEPYVAEVEPEPEPVVAEVEPEVEPEPVVAEMEPELVAEMEPEPEPEPVVAVVEPEPPATPKIAPIAETILRFPTQPAPEPPTAEPVAAQDDTPELAARRAQLDSLGLGDPGQGPVSGERANVLPYRSRGATPTPTELAAIQATGGFWEASAREVAGAAAHVGVQNCGECGLSLSATARFCRRCGTRQAQPA